MHFIFIIINKVLKNLTRVILQFISGFITWLKLNGNDIVYGKNFSSRGIPIFDIALEGKCFIGNNFSMNNGINYNRIGRQQKCMFIISKGAVLNIGNNVGMSGTAIVCTSQINVGNYVKIGGNCVIYDTISIHWIT